MRLLPRRRAPRRDDPQPPRHEPASAVLIPPGTRIFTSWSPKVKVAHVKSAVNPGSVCETFSQREDWLGWGSDEEREHVLSLRLCSRCDGDYGETAAS